MAAATVTVTLADNGFDVSVSGTTPDKRVVHWMLSAALHAVMVPTPPGPAVTPVPADALRRLNGNGPAA